MDSAIWLESFAGLRGLRFGALDRLGIAGIMARGAMKGGGAMRIAFGVFALWVGMTPVIAADKSGAYTIRGPGTVSCGTWTQDRQSRGHLAFQDSAWVSGYVTAVNNYLWRGKDIAAGIDASGLDAWVDNYCASHPLDSIANAAEALVAELHARPQPPD